MRDGRRRQGDGRPRWKLDYLAKGPQDYVSAALWVVVPKRGDRTHPPGNVLLVDMAVGDRVWSEIESGGRKRVALKGWLELGVSSTELSHQVDI